MYSCGPPHMDVQKQDDQHELTYSNYVRTRDVTLKTSRRRWMIGRSSERGSGISVLAVRHDDDDDDIYIYIYIYIYIRLCAYMSMCLSLFVSVCVCMCVFVILTNINIGRIREKTCHKMSKDRNKIRNSKRADCLKKNSCFCHGFNIWHWTSGMLSVTVIIVGNRIDEQSLSHYQRFWR